MESSCALPGFEAVSDDDEDSAGGGIRKRGGTPRPSHGRGGTIIGGCTQIFTLIVTITSVSSSVHGNIIYVTSTHWS